MTLIVTVNGRESIWMCADRRLSAEGRRPRDDGRKLVILETPDGVSLLGYAGLGATGLGVELSDWTSAVLRGRRRTLEESLMALAGAMQRQLPRHMVRMPGKTGPTHALITSAMMADGEVRLYMFQIVFAPDRRRYAVRIARCITDDTVGSARPRVQRYAVAGSGASILLNRGTRWRRDLLRVVRASDRGKVPPRAVADHLAALNESVHREDRHELVGPTCIVAWRNRNGGVHGGGGSSQGYIGTQRDPTGAAVPVVSSGVDIIGLFGALTKWLRHPAGAPVDTDLGQKPPDERLR